MLRKGDLLVNIFNAIEGIFDICCQRKDMAHFLNLQGEIGTFDLKCVYSQWSNHLTDNYAEDGGQLEAWILCSFYHEHLRTWIKTNVNNFPISNHTALKLRKLALKSYLKIYFVNFNFVCMFTPHCIWEVSVAKLLPLSPSLSRIRTVQNL